MSLTMRLLITMMRHSSPRLRLEHEQDAVLVVVVVEVLVDAAVLDQYDVAGLPFHGAAVVNVMAVALEHENGVSPAR